MAIEHRDYWKDIPEYRRLTGQRKRRSTEGVQIGNSLDPSPLFPDGIPLNEPPPRLPEDADLRGQLRR
jgi:hypothetical protein